MMRAMIKAAVCEKYGPPDVVRLADVPKPDVPDNGVLIRVQASTVNSGDARVRALRVPRGLSLPVRLALGWRRPKQPILGLDAAGLVEAIGAKVTTFKVGDRVLGSRRFAFGCHAEYVCVAEDGALAIIPDGLSFEDAVSLPFGGVAALAFFRQGQLKAGESLLINGASGAVGVMAVQLAKHIGATVTAVCSARNAELVRSLGADYVIDYAKTNFTLEGETYDVIMDTHGNTPYARVKHLLKPGGRFLMVIADLLQMLAAKLNTRIIDGEAEKPSDVISARNYSHLLGLAETGVIKPVIDSVYPFAQIVEAHRRVDSGHKAGSVVIRFSD